MFAVYILVKTTSIRLNSFGTCCRPENPIPVHEQNPFITNKDHQKREYCTWFASINQVKAGNNNNRNQRNLAQS